MGQQVRSVLGTMTFGDTVDIDGARRILDAGRDHGVVEIDTANVYTGGAAESMLGELLAGRAHGFSIAGKVGIPHPDALGEPPLSPTAIRRCVDMSLKRLRIERLELLYLHQPDRTTPLDETIGAVAELEAAGKVGELGLSNYSAWMTRDVAVAAANAGMSPPAVGQQLLNLVARRLEEEYLEMAVSSGLRTYVYNPLGGGLLTGRHDFGDVPATGRFGDSRLAPMYQDRYWDARLFEAVTDYATIAREAEIGLVELALRWLAGHPGVDGVLVGASRVDHVVENLVMLAKGPLPSDVIEACDAVGARLRGPMPAYHR